jgi:superoxide reductase
MKKLGEHFQESDWKKEKHVPVIECSDSVTSGTFFDVKVSLGKEIAHPNTTEHHIRWIQLFFQPEGEKFTYHVGTFEFCAHGESVDGPNTGSVYTNHSATASMKITKPGTIYALAFCNIHGMWESAKDVKLEA